MKASSASLVVMIAATSFVSGGCFTYVPVELSTIPTGEMIQLYLTPQEMRQLRDEAEEGLPVSGPPRVHGTLVRSDAQAVALRIPIATRSVGFLQGSIDRQVTIPTREITAIERRQLDRVKSTLMVAGATGAVAAFMVLIVQDAQRPPGKVDVDYPGDSIRIPLFSLGLP